MPDNNAASPDNWDVHWVHYADSAEKNPAQLMRHDFIAGLLKQSDSRGEIRLLDLGSGQGDLLQRLAPLFPKARFVGVELSESGVAISRRKAPLATFLVADIFNPPPALDEFSNWATHAVCSEVLEHVDDPIAFLERARDYIAAGGQLIVTVPGGPMSAFDRHIGHRQHFNRGKITRILTDAGYQPGKTFLAGFPFFNLYRLMVIARGKKLARDIESQAGGFSSSTAGVAMKMFHGLFRANLSDSPFGWQVIATAAKPA